MQRILLRAVVVSLCATAAAAIFVLLFGDFGDEEGRILGTTVAISAYGLLASPCSALLEDGRRTGLALAGLGLTAAGFVMVNLLIWDDGIAEDLWRTWLTITAAAGAVAQACALLARSPRAGPDPVSAIRVIAIALASALVVLIAIAAWREPDSDSAYYRLMGAVGVADVLALALVPVVGRMRRDAGAAPDGQRFRCTLDSGEAVEVQAAGFDDAARRAGGRVMAVERL